MSAIPATDVRLPSPWRIALPAIVLTLLAIGLVYRDTAVAMVDIWSRSDTFAHAFLVPPIVLWLVWRQRDVLARLTPRPMPSLLAGILGAAALWLVSDLAVVNAASQFAFVAMLVLTVPAVLGWSVAHAILFPLLFLFFAVPAGEFMVPPMMEWTADFVVLALQATGIPVYREGLWFVIPSGQWSVVDACSGVRYLIASFMVGSLFAYLNYRSPGRRAVFVLVSILLPIVANWLRAYMIVMIGHLSNNQIAVGVDHILYGWVFFGVVIFLMFMVGMRWAEPDAPVDTSPVQALPLPGAGAGSAAGLAAVAAMVVGVALLPHAVNWNLQRAEQAAAAPQLKSQGFLVGADAPVPVWGPRWLNPTASLHREVSAPAGDVGVYVAYYRGQGPDSKLVSSVNGVVGINERVWQAVGGGVAAVGTPVGEVRFRGTHILGPEGLRAGSQRLHVVAWQVYWIDGRFIAGDAEAKLRNAAARLQGRGDDGAVLVLHASGDSFDAAAASLATFARDNVPAIAAMLQATRDAR